MGVIASRLPREWKKRVNLKVMQRRLLVPVVVWLGRAEAEVASLGLELLQQEESRTVLWVLNCVLYYHCYGCMERTIQWVDSGIASGAGSVPMQMCVRLDKIRGAEVLCSFGYWSEAKFWFIGSVATLHTPSRTFPFVDNTTMKERTGTPSFSRWASCLDTDSGENSHSWT